MRTGRPALALAALLALWPVLAHAKPSLDAVMEPDTLAVGEEGLYSLTVTDALGGQPTFPRFGDLHAEGPSETMQSSISIVNGQQSVQTSHVYTWRITAPREGRFVIGPATLRHNGETFTSEPVTVTCSGQAQAQRPRARQRNPFGGAFGSPFDAFDDFPDPFNRRAMAGDGDVFLRAVVDKNEAYLGEQVTLSLYLFSQADVAGVQSVSFPKLDGFWAEDIEAPTQLTPEIKSVKGVPYRAYLLRRRALFPLRAGELVIDPVEAQVNLGLSMFFGAPQDSVKRKSSALKLVVKPLPAEGQPPGFEAANVGEMSLSAKATPTKLPLGQPVQLKVVLEGGGNLKGVQLPRPKLPEGLKTFDPTITDKVRVGGGRYGGTKTIEWVVIPERTGAFTIPAIELPYFNPGKATYDVAKTAPIDLDVTAPADGALIAKPGGNLGVSTPVAANVLSGGIRPIRVNALLVPTSTDPVWKRPYFWPLTAGPVALWMLVWSGTALVGFVRRRDPEKLKVKRAKGQAGKRLKTARELLSANRPKEFYAEVLTALQQFVADKIGVPALGLTHDQLLRHLSEKGVLDGDREAFVRLMETCETGRFAPMASDPRSLAGVLDEATRLIDAIDGLKPGRAA